MVSWVHGVYGRLDEWDQASWRSIEHARRAGDHREEVEVLAGLSINAAVGSLPAEKGVRRCEEILELVEGNRRAEAFVLLNLGLLHAITGRFSTAREIASQARSMLRDIGAFVHFGAAISLSALTERLAGNPDGAERELQEGKSLLDAWAGHRHRQWLDTELAKALYEQGRYKDALPLVAGSMEDEDLEGQISADVVLGKILARVGRPDEGMTKAREAAARAAETDDLVLRVDTLLDLGEALEAGERVDEAALTLDEALRVAEEKGYTIAVDRARGALARLRARTA